jgi:hypothetical protein
VDPQYDTHTHTQGCTHESKFNSVPLQLLQNVKIDTQNALSIKILNARHIYVNIQKTTELTPCWCRYWTVETITCMTALASLSEKNLCLRILSSNSPPLISSITSYTDLSSSYTCEISYTHISLWQLWQSTTTMQNPFSGTADFSATKPRKTFTVNIQNSRILQGDWKIPVHMRKKGTALCWKCRSPTHKTAQVARITFVI